MGEYLVYSELENYLCQSTVLRILGQEMATEEGTLLWTREDNYKTIDVYRKEEIYLTFNSISKLLKKFNH